MAQDLFKREGNALRRIAERVRNAGELYLFLDYDGTVVRLRKTPPLAVLSTRARAFLRQLKGLPGTTLGVITGRSLTDIRKLLRLGGVVLAANHGFEILDGPHRWTHPEARRLRSRLSTLSTVLRQRLRHIPRLLVENKGSTLSVHFRNVPPARVGEVRQIVQAVVRSHRLSVNITRGKKVIEIRPGVSWGKGHALRKILSARGGSRDRLVIYCGDDATDEDAFRLLPDDALTIRVGKAPRTAARYRARKVSDVYRFLRIIDTERRKHTTAISRKKKSP